MKKNDTVELTPAAADQTAPATENTTPAEAATPDQFLLGALFDIHATPQFVEL